jgi:hypothetical protein
MVITAFNLYNIGSCCLAVLPPKGSNRCRPRRGHCARCPHCRMRKSAEKMTYVGALIKKTDKKTVEEGQVMI